MKNRTAFAATLAVIMVFGLGCGKKKEETKPAAKVPDKTEGREGAREPAREAARPAAPAAEMVEMALPKTKFKIKVPKGTKVTEAIIPNTDLVKFPGMRSAMIVKPRLITDKTLEKLIPWAKGHQIQKYAGDVLKTGSGKTYTYIYNVTMGGMKKAVYHQMFQQGGKDYMCFSNADSAEAAKTMKKSCDTITK